MYFSLITSLLFLSTASTAASEDWTADIEAAREQAKTENKFLIIKFTGSDWCPPCQMIEKAVFSKEEFTKYASEKFILCIIDSPRGNKELAKKNKPILNQFKISSYPTLVLVDSEQGEFYRFNPANFETIEKMKTQLDLQIRRKDMF